jgi:hypothetical protein
VVFGQALIAGVDEELDLRVRLQQHVDAFDPHGRGVVHTSWSGGPAPQGRSVFVGCERGFDGVLADLAGHERLAPAPPGPRATNSDLGGVQP